MATVQGERIAGGCIVIAGIDSTQYAVRQQAVSVVPMPMSATTNDRAATWGHAFRMPCTMMDEVLRGSHRGAALT